jgi:hypothetical protein
MPPTTIPCVLGHGRIGDDLIARPEWAVDHFSELGVMIAGHNPDT